MRLRLSTEHYLLNLREETIAVEHYVTKFFVQKRNLLIAFSGTEVKSFREKKTFEFRG